MAEAYNTPHGELDLDLHGKYVYPADIQFPVPYDTEYRRVRHIHAMRMSERIEQHLLKLGVASSDSSGNCVTARELLPPYEEIMSCYDSWNAFRSPALSRDALDSYVKAYYGLDVDSFEEGDDICADNTRLDCLYNGL